MSQNLLADGTMAPPQKGTKRQSRKPALLAAAGLLALLGIAWYGINYLATGQYIETTDDAYVGGDVTDLAPQVSGLIITVAVTDNQAVHKGDLLVKIDDRDDRAALAKAQAAVAGDQASLANLNATRNLQMAMIREAAADLASARAQTALASADSARYRALARAQAGSLQDSQRANANLGQAAAAVAKAQAAEDAAEAQLAVLDTQTSETNAALAGVLADVTTARLNLGYTEITAPFDGTIGNRVAHLGGYATAGAPLLSIVPANGLWVDANFKEDQLARMQPGQPVRITADVLPGRKITGHLGSLAPATGAVFSILPAENATGNFTKIVQRVPVRILLDGDAARLGLLRPGLSVTASVDTK